MSISQSLRYVDDLVRVSLSGQRLNVLQDTNWNVVALTPSTGTILERYTYNAFGKRNIYDASFTPRPTTLYPTFTRSFTGQILDTETGLMLYRNRHYHPTLGRFIQRDPIGYSARDVNLYRYVRNAPVFGYDVFGLAYVRPIRPSPPDGQPVPPLLPDPAIPFEQHIKNDCDERLKNPPVNTKDANDNFTEIDDKDLKCCKDRLLFLWALTFDYGINFNAIQKKCNLRVECKACKPPKLMGFVDDHGDTEPVPSKLTLYLCWNNLKDKPAGTDLQFFLHEMIHAYDRCHYGPTGTCSTLFEREMRAHYCANQCDTYEECFWQALPSMCQGSCDGTKLASLYNDENNKYWFEDSLKNQPESVKRKMCNFPDVPVL